MAESHHRRWEVDVSATDLSHSTLRSLIEIGVNHFVLSPGSRNAPLSLALYEASEKGLVNLHVRIDERSASYFALGIAKATDNYVAVICTSGTAAANFHPAALEAHHSWSKVIFITADRPARLRKTGANQTTLQVGLLSPLNTHDMSSPHDVTEWLDGGPIHLNIQFDEPLIEIEKKNWLDGLRVEPYFNENLEATLMNASPRSAIIIGHDRAGLSIGEIEDFLEEVNLPVIAEDPLAIPGAIPHASLFLADQEIRKSLKADQLFVIGRTTLSRSINAFINQSENVVVIDPRLENVDSNRSAQSKLSTLPFIECEIDDDWNMQWKNLASLNIDMPAWSEQKAIASIAKSIPAGSALFVGSSRPARDIEAVAHHRPHIYSFANRGLAGIDGNISTALGIAEVFEKTVAILGDITFLHDLSALVNTSPLNLTVFVIDNNGGGIFSTLPQASSDGFEQIFGTPHNLNLEKIIQSFGLNVVRAKNESDIQREILQSGLHFVVVEVPSRSENAKHLQKLHQMAANAARIGANLA